jgi:hypothetical protein
MVGYSGTPLPKKLGIKEGSRVAILNGPKGFTATLGELPLGATTTTKFSGKAPYDVVIAFITRGTDLAPRLAATRPRLTAAGAIWVAWPKKASKVPTDMTEDVVRAVALPTGLVDNKVCAIDETWSGLRLVVRVALRERPSRPPVPRR